MVIASEESEYGSDKIPQKMYKNNCVSRTGTIASLVSNSSKAYNGLQKISCCSRSCPSPRSWYELIFQKNFRGVLTMLAASPSHVRRNAACAPLEPIVSDLLENLFDNECGDTVSFLSHYYYEHLSKNPKGSRCSASLFP